MQKVDLPNHTLLSQQAEWLAPARAQLLRRIGIAHRRKVLDLGAGYGSITPELVRRAKGPVIAFDHNIAALHQCAAISVDAYQVGGNSNQLPFRRKTFDLVFSQFSLLWMSPLASTSAEIWRVLQPGGILIALEPDYGGMIEYPPEITSRHIWIQALSRAGAEPYVGRKLPGILEKQGFTIQVRLIEVLHPPALKRFDFLKDIPLNQEEQQELSQIEHYAAQLTGWQQIAHLPLFFITAEK